MSSSRPPLNPSTTADDDHLTWLNFLRSAGNTAPERPAVERSTSIDRKRRHTGSEHSGPSRAYPYPTSAASSSANIAASSGTLRRPSAMSTSISTGAATGTAEAPIDLTSPPPTRPTPPTHRSSVSSHHSHSIRARTSREGGDSRRSSELRLPRWQPDHEATQCPVCKNDFGFWNRRHHCRKCGRVVCSACSPHRITIPRQYIVQPPSPFGSEFGVEQGAENELSRILGGGEVVRVCNPCVPDPWTPENASIRGGAEEDGRPRPLIEGARNAGQTAQDRVRHGMPMPPPPPTPHIAPGRHRSQSHQPAPTTSATLSRSISPPSPQAVQSIISRDRAYTRPDPSSPHQSRSISHRYAHSHSHALPPLPSFPGRSGDPSRPPITTAPSAPPQPRRIVREEDECPVCGTEMPPGEQVREAHIQSCIASRFSSSTPSSSALPSMPPPPPQPPVRRSSQASIPGPTASAFSPPTATNTESTTRPRATSYRPRGMALYTATEKDCLDPSGAGEAQECVICLEEFQPGDGMGRMECLCKFHRACIRGWWERKGVGSCPTHQLHD